VLNSDGTFTKSGDGELLPESINVKVSNGYAEFTKEFEIQYSTSSLTQLQVFTPYTQVTSSSVTLAFNVKDVEGNDIYADNYTVVFGGVTYEVTGNQEEFVTHKLFEGLDPLTTYTYTVQAHKSGYLSSEVITRSTTTSPTVELENLRLLTEDGLVEVTEDLSIVRSYFVVTTSDVGAELDVTLTYGDESTELHTLPYSHSVGADRYYSCYWRPIKNLEQSLVT
jgi:hypothetical protein